MIYNPRTVEDNILSLLQKGSIGTAELLTKVQANRPGSTKQALYQALRKLKKEEVVVMRSKQVSLSHIWINKMTHYFKEAGRAYGETTEPSEDFLKLRDGEKVSYTFQSPEITDIFWGHAFSILSGLTRKDIPICIYNPHEWFMVARVESEKHLFQTIKENGKQLLVLVGNSDPIDILVRSEFDGNLLQYHTEKGMYAIKEGSYVNIFGDFIIEAVLDDRTNAKIDAFYKNTSEITLETKEQLKQIVTEKGKTKLTISRNPRKADKLRRIFRRYFLIKKQP